jgi:O-antigen biosynthesis protein
VSADCRVTFVLVAQDSPEQCLKLLAEHTTVPYRTVIVDGAGTVVDGATVVPLPDGLDSGTAHNLGARHADTEFICFLNPEVEVTAGWLEPLVALLDSHPRAASAAPVLDDGRLYFTTALDHVSTACLLIRRSAFHAAGGFTAGFGTDDPEFSAALRSLGWQLWLCPQSKVLSMPPVDYVERADRVASFRVLLIDDRVPQVDRGRGDPRTQAVVDEWRAADDLARVTYFAALPDRAEDYAPALRERGIEVIWGEDPVEWAATRPGYYDVVTVFRPHNLNRAGEPIARYQPQAVLVYDSEALFHRRPEQHYETCEDPVRREEFAAEAKTLRAIETHAFQWADVGVCVSEDEAAWARAADPTTSVHVACYPTRLDRAVPGFHERSGIVFFGGFDGTPNTPNEYAALALAGEVLPELRERHPGTLTRIVGADPSPAVLALESEHIKVVGRVPDPHPLLASALVHVVPMRYGAGVKAKFIDTMAAGLPFVTTPVGGEGLYLGPLAEHLIGESSAELVELTSALLTDQTLWTDIQGQLLEICRRYFSHEAFTREMRAVIADCGIPAT